MHKKNFSFNFKQKAINHISQCWLFLWLKENKKIYIEYSILSDKQLLGNNNTVVHAISLESHGVCDLTADALISNLCVRYMNYTETQTLCVCVCVYICYHFGEKSKVPYQVWKVMK